MPYVPPAAVVTGTTITSAWGTSVKTGMDYLANPPACRVYHNAAQATVNNVALALSFNSERYDTNTMHDTVTNNGRITIKTAGLYHVYASIEFAANATGFRQIYFQVNGATIIAASSIPTPGTGVGAGLVLSTEWKFAVNDYILCVVAQNSGGGLNVLSGNAYTPEFGASWIGLG
jgi:hypothetical protein